jgi:S-adenosylmethionine-dependent methyltransferase
MKQNIVASWARSEPEQNAVFQQRDLCQVDRACTDAKGAQGVPVQPPAVQPVRAASCSLSTIEPARQRGWQEKKKMSDDITDIAFFYNSDPEREQVRLEQHQLEYDLTWRYLNQYLPIQGSILEVGSATGRYTLELAKRGYTLTAVDLSAALLELCRKNIAGEGLESQVQFVVADARNLDDVAGKGFDAVLLMGPLYHLIVEADRKMTLQGAFDRLREGGIIFSAFLSRFGMLADLLKNKPGWIEDQSAVRSQIERGKRPDDSPRGGFRGYAAQVSEIAPLHEAIGFETLAVAGVEPAIAGDDESYNKLQGKQRQLWLDLLYAISTESSMVGASRHLLYVGRKKSGIKQ